MTTLETKRTHKLSILEIKEKIITADPTGIKRLREYNKQLYTYKFNIIDKMYRFLKNHKHQNSLKNKQITKKSYI